MTEEREGPQDTFERIQETVRRATLLEIAGLARAKTQTHPTMAYGDCVAELQLFAQELERMAGQDVEDKKDQK